MQVLSWETFLAQGLPSPGASTAISVGVFDGVHRGHQALVDRIMQSGMIPVIITFKHNYKNVQPSYHGDISSFDKKMALFAGMGVAITVIAELTDSFRSMSGAEFFRLLRERANMGFLAVGSNFRCGNRQDTDAPLIQELNTREHVATEIIETLCEDGLPISSTRIRSAIHQGKLSEAQAMIGRPYTLDLMGAAFQSEGSDTIYPTGQLGRVLPPCGSYPVILHSESDSVSSHIRIEKDRLICPQPVHCIEFQAFS